LDNILSFIKPELFILVIFLYCVGLFLKLYKGFKRDWMIPYILLGVSFLMTLAYVSIFMVEGFSPPVIVAVIIQSVLIAAVTVFGNELIQQVLKRNNYRIR
jgi:heme/copper-type cytochrome/quinol oxidase subunit 4